MPTLGAAAQLDLVDRLTAPWDAARRRCLRFVLRAPVLGALVSDRDRRIAAMSAVAVLVAFVLSALAPALLFVLSPVVLGVPHVASDLRYLVLRRRLSGAWKVTIFGISGALVVLRLVQELGMQDPEVAVVEVGIAGGWIVLAAVVGAAVSGAWRRLGWLLLALAVPVALAVRHPYGAALIVTHAHNVVAVLLWLVLFRRRLRAVIAPLAMMLIGTALLLSGALAPIAGRVGGLGALGVELGWAAEWLAPGLTPSLALNVTMAYVFLQAIHYSVWLGWIPQEDVRAEGTLTFRMSVRALLADFGRVGLACIAIGWISVAAFAARDVMRTRETYLSLAAFHGYLELAMLAYLLMAARPAARS